MYLAGWFYVYELFYLAHPTVIISKYNVNTLDYSWLICSGETINPLYACVGRKALHQSTNLFVWQIIHISNTDIYGVRRAISLWPDMELQATNLTS